MRVRGAQKQGSEALASGPVKEDITSLLILRFQEMLRQKIIRQGSRLPPERELAAHFNVARSSLRQALKVLEIMGVITQKVGDGSYLNTDTSAILSVPMEFLFLLDDTSVQELTELRLLIEPGLARLAAQRATAEDVALLRQSIHDFEQSGKDTLRIVSSDLLFHRAIFQASKNGPSARIFHSIHRAMARMMLVTSQLVDLEHTLSFHKPIMLAIERREGERAAKLMAEHLADATALLVKEQAHQHDQLLHSHLAASQRPLVRKTAGRVRGRRKILSNRT
jgi:GntR family transcriptional repressor for pyruvate dehydrogenase complex